MTGPVIAGVDGSAPGRAAAEVAAEMASRHHRKLELIHVFAWPLLYPWFEEDAEPYDASPRQRVQTLLHTTATDLAERYPHLPIRTRLLEGHAAGILAQQSRQASCVVIGHRGTGGFAELLAGSVAVYTATHASCPVLVVRGMPERPDAPVVVGVDNSPASLAALRVALVEAELRGADVIAALASARTPERGGPDSLSGTLAAHVPGGCQVKVRTEYPHGHSVEEALLDLCTTVAAGLLVIGSRGSGGFRGLRLGGTARALIDHSPTAVMVVPKVPARKPAAAGSG